MCFTNVQKQKWYTGLFNVYLRFVFVKVSVGSMLLFLALFMAGFAIYTILSEITGWTDFFEMILCAELVLAFIVTVIITKRIKKK